MDGYLGCIMMWAGTYVPEYWEACEGQLLNISVYPALYSVLGTQYGGDGRTTFALPDLRGRFPVGYGGIGIPGRVAAVMGATGGATAAQVNVAVPAQNVNVRLPLPAHTHNLGAAAKVSSLLNVGTTGSTNQSITPTAGASLVTSPNTPLAAGLFSATAPTASVALNNTTISSSASGSTDVAGSGADAGFVTGAVPVAGAVVPVAVPVLNPFQGVRFIICVQGLYATHHS